MCRWRPLKPGKSDITSFDGAARGTSAHGSDERVDVAEETGADSRLRLLVDAGMALTAELSLDGLLQRLIETAAELTGARYVALGVVAPDGSRLERFVTHGIDAATRESIGDPPQGRGILGALLKDAKPLRLEDLTKDPRSVGFPPNHPPMRSFLGVPVLLRNVPFGNLYLTEKAEGGKFTSDDEELVTLLAAQAAVAIENARLYGAATRNVAAQELERQRLARELHDETGQALTSILLGLRSLEDTLESAESRAAVAHVRALAVNTLQDVRRLAVELRPKALDDFGLVAALERLTETWSAETAIAVDLTASIDDQLFSNELATALYRIIQESLTNVVKHAHASHVSILLTRKNESVVAVIEDNGDGFAADKASDRFGIVGMRERVALLDGRLQIESAKGAGTTLVVELPLA